MRLRILPQFTDGNSDDLPRVHRPANTSRGRSGELFSATVDSLIDAGLSVRFRARGNSMSPTIRDGEYLIVAPIDATQVAVGDVLFCDMRRGPIAHRVCAIERPSDRSLQFRLYGDASLDGDPPVAAGQLRGQVVGVERDGARVSLKVSSGSLGRAIFVLALHFRRSLRIARTRWNAPLIPVATTR
jgi:hypothetical protein